MMYENCYDHSFFMDQDLLGSLQVNLSSQASGGQFVPLLPLNPSLGAFIVYTGTSGGVKNASDESQTPSDTDAREDNDTTLSVRKVSAQHTLLCYRNSWMP